MQQELWARVARHELYLNVTWPSSFRINKCLSQKHHYESSHTQKIPRKNTYKIWFLRKSNFKTVENVLQKYESDHLWPNSTTIDYYFKSLSQNVSRLPKESRIRPIVFIFLYVLMGISWHSLRNGFCIYLVWHIKNNLPGHPVVVHFLKTSANSWKCSAAKIWKLSTLKN